VAFTADDTILKIHHSVPDFTKRILNLKLRKIKPPKPSKTKINRYKDLEFYKVKKYLSLLKNNDRSGDVI